MFMPVSINTNLASVRGQRAMGNASEALNKTYQRLSSGQRINTASDDAAGLAIAESLRINQRVAGIAIRNAQDGISAIAITDGALSSITQVLGRLAELAQQAGNGSYSATQRSALQMEFDTLGSEIERIAVTTTYNGVALLSGSQVISFQVGFDGASTSQISLDQRGGATLQKLGLAAVGSSALTFSVSGTNTDFAQSAARQALAAINGAVVSVNALRGTLGTVEARLGSAITNLSTSRENTLAAEARITDADVAIEAAELTRLNILQQAGASVLAQANQQPQLAVQLLR
jgi:flagellin